MTICKECGAVIPEAGRNRRFCDNCVHIHKVAAAKRRAEEYRIRKEMEQYKPIIKSIAEIQREAKAAGMSYGQYVASLRR